MSSRVCAIVVTGNHREALRRCLNALLAQTRSPECVLVVDNVSIDGSREMLSTEFPGASRLDLKENAGGAGAINAGMRWTHCNKFDWTWVMDDTIEPLPDCLEKMLAVADDADMIQVKVAAPGRTLQPDPGTFRPVRDCAFHGALIGRKVIETAGLPDHRYYRSGDDVAYGYIASLHAKSICLDYTGVIRHATDEPPTPVSFYLDVRNRFLTRENLAKGGAPLASATFLAETFAALLKTLSAAIESPGRLRNARAAIDGLRDGIHSRFDRLPAV